MSRKKLGRGNSQGGKKLAAPNTETGSTNQLTPAFSLQYLDGNYCLSHCDQEKKAAFADTLHKLSKMTWADIQRSPKHGRGHEIIRQDAIQATLPGVVTPEVTLLAFRFSGKAPMVGFRDQRVFHVLFLDRDFSLYDH